MILYTPEPLEFLSQDKSETAVMFKLPSGGLVMAEPYEYNKLKIINIISTEPMDYMNARFQPGSLIEMVPDQ
jgi:hypothetical protein